MNKKSCQTPRVELQWSRLLGFDQVERPASGKAGGLKDRHLARLGSKIGDKQPSSKPD